MNNSHSWKWIVTFLILALPIGYLWAWGTAELALDGDWGPLLTILLVWFATDILLAIARGFANGWYNEREKTTVTRYTDIGPTTQVSFYSPFRYLSTVVGSVVRRFRVW
jgi:hypothetical protein